MAQRTSNYVEASFSAENTFSDGIDMPAGTTFMVGVIPDQSNGMGANKVTLYFKPTATTLLPSPGWYPIAVYTSASMQTSTVNTIGAIFETFIAGENGSYRLGVEAGDYDTDAVYGRIARGGK